MTKKDIVFFSEVSVNEIGTTQVGEGKVGIKICESVLTIGTDAKKTITVYPTLELNAPQKIRKTKPGLYATGLIELHPYDETPISNDELLWFCEYEYAIIKNKGIKNDNTVVNYVLQDESRAKKKSRLKRIIGQ